jgi:hypothetical protein
MTLPAESAAPAARHARPRMSARAACCPRCRAGLDGGPVVFWCPACRSGVQAADLDRSFHPRPARQADVIYVEHPITGYRRACAAPASTSRATGSP